MMRKYGFCLLALLLLLLCGCVSSQLAPETPSVTEDTTLGESDETRSAQEPETEVETETMPVIVDEPQPLPGQGDDDLLAVLTDPGAPEYIALAEGAEHLSTPMVSEHDPDITLLVPLQDGVRIVVEIVEYDFHLNWFVPLETLYDFTATANRAYALSAQLAETLPMLRVVAEYEDKEAVWYCQHDGQGGRIQFFAGENPEPPPLDEFSSMIPLSVAIACTAYQIDVAESQLGSERIGADGGYFWLTIAQAITLSPPLGLPDIDPDSDEWIPVPGWMVEHYAKALFPEIDYTPELPDSVKYDATTEQYVFAPISYGDYLIWSLAAIENDEDGLGGSITLHMLCESQDPEPVLMSVVWRANPNVGRNTPFAYQLIEVNFLAG